MFTKLADDSQAYGRRRLSISISPTEFVENHWRHRRTKNWPSTMHTRRFASSILRQIALEQRTDFIRHLHKGAASQSYKLVDTVTIDEPALDWYLEFESARWNRVLAARNSDVRFWFGCACVLSVLALGALAETGKALSLMPLLTWLVPLLVLG